MIKFSSRGQTRHKGSTLCKSDIEEKIKSSRCKCDTKLIRSPKSGTYITKYVLDLNIEHLITEVRIYADQNGKFTIPVQYWSDVTDGSKIKALVVALYSEGVMSNDRIASFLNAACNDELSLSEGSIYSFCKSFSQKVEGSIIQLESELLNQAIVSTDVATVSVNGKQGFIRNFCI